MEDALGEIVKSKSKFVTNASDMAASDGKFSAPSFSKALGYYGYISYNS